MGLRQALLAGFSLIGASQIWLGYITTSLNDFNSLVGPAIMAGVGLGLLFVPIQVVVLFAFARLTFGVTIHGSAIATLGLALLGSWSFAGLGLLCAARAENSETANGLINGTLMAVALLILGVPLALPIGVLTFFGAYFPIVGTVATGTLAAWPVSPSIRVTARTTRPAGPRRASPGRCGARPASTCCYHKGSTASWC